MNLNQFQKGMDSRFKDLIGSCGFGGGLNPFQQGQQQALQLQQQQQALEIQKENFFIKVQQDNFNEDWNLKLK